MVEHGRGRAWGGGLGRLILVGSHACIRAFYPWPCVCWLPARSCRACWSSETCRTCTQNCRWGRGGRGAVPRAAGWVVQSRADAGAGVRKPSLCRHEPHACASGFHLYWCEVCVRAFCTSACDAPGPLTAQRPSAAAPLDAARAAGGRRGRKRTAAEAADAAEAAGTADAAGAAGAADQQDCGEGGEGGAAAGQAGEEGSPDAGPGRGGASSHDASATGSSNLEVGARTHARREIA